MVEGRADVQRRGRRRRSGPATTAARRSRRPRPASRWSCATGVRSKRAVRRSPETDSGAILIIGARDSPGSSHTTSCSPIASRAPATSWTSSRPPRARCRAASASDVLDVLVGVDLGHRLMAHVAHRRQRQHEIATEGVEPRRPGELGARKTQRVVEPLGRPRSSRSAVSGSSSRRAGATARSSIGDGEFAGDGRGDAVDELVTLVDDRRRRARAAPGCPRSRRSPASRGW